MNTHHPYSARVCLTPTGPCVETVGPDLLKVIAGVTLLAVVTVGAVYLVHQMQAGSSPMLGP